MVVQERLVLVAKSEAVQRIHQTIETVQTLAEQEECRCMFSPFLSYQKIESHLRYAFSALTCSGERV